MRLEEAGQPGHRKRKGCHLMADPNEAGDAVAGSHRSWSPQPATHGRPDGTISTSGRGTSASSVLASRRATTHQPRPGQQQRRALFSHGSSCFFFSPCCACCLRPLRFCGMCATTRELLGCIPFSAVHAAAPPTSPFITLRMDPLAVNAKGRFPCCPSVWGFVSFFVANRCPVCCCENSSNEFVHLSSFPQVWAPLQFFLSQPLGTSASKEGGVDIGTGLLRMGVRSKLLLNFPAIAGVKRDRTQQGLPLPRPCKVLPNFFESLSHRSK